MEGWALGRQLPVASVELVHERNCLRRVAPDVQRPDLGSAHPDLAGIGSSGFYASVSPLALETEFELRRPCGLRGQDAGRDRDDPGAALCAANELRAAPPAPDDHDARAHRLQRGHPAPERPPPDRGLPALRVRAKGRHVLDGHPEGALRPRQLPQADRGGRQARRLLVAGQRGAGPESGSRRRARPLAGRRGHRGPGRLLPEPHRGSVRAGRRAGQQARGRAISPRSSGRTRQLR